uniref:Uncharacterized protein n=1 Tax=Anguilla anguilla TaxID=7936 RepID=A0A0E9U820_ANGAN
MFPWSHDLCCNCLYN